MEAKVLDWLKIPSWDSKIVTILLFLFACLEGGAIFLHWNSLTVELSKIEKEINKKERDKIFNNYRLWKKLPISERKKWCHHYERFHQYPIQDQQYLTQICSHWQQLPEQEKKRCQSGRKIFNELPPEAQESIRCEAIFMEYFDYEREPLPSAKSLDQWVSEFKDLKKPKRLPPMALRRYIHQYLRTLKVVPLLPPNLQKYWKTLPVEDRMKVLKDIQRESEKQQRIFLIKALQKEIEKK